MDPYPLLEHTLTRAGYSPQRPKGQRKCRPSPAYGGARIRPGFEGTPARLVYLRPMRRATEGLGRVDPEGRRYPSRRLGPDRRAQRSWPWSSRPSPRRRGPAWSSCALRAGSSPARGTAPRTRFFSSVLMVESSGRSDGLVARGRGHDPGLEVFGFELARERSLRRRRNTPEVLDVGPTGYLAGSGLVLRGRALRVSRGIEPYQLVVGQAGCGVFGGARGCARLTLVHEVCSSWARPRGAPTPPGLLYI